MESVVIKIKKTISLLLGITISTIVVQFLFILNAVRFNYYSGIDPLSTIDKVLIYIPIEAGIAVIILICLRILKARVIQKPSEYFLLGAILGLSNLGSVLRFWLLPEYIEYIVYIIVLIISAVFSISSLQKANYSES
jgi:hypothetical protein